MLTKLTCVLFVAGTVAAQNQFRERSTGANTAIWDAKFVDIDGDGDEDLLQSASALVIVKRNDGSGHFTDESITIQTTGFITLQVGDFDGDGDDDAFAVAPYVQGSVLLRNDGGPIGVVSQSLSSFSGPIYASASADFDGDGDLDIALAPGQGSPMMLVNDGTGTFVVDVTPFSGISFSLTSTIAVGNFNGDTAPDLFVMTFSNSAVLLNDGTGSFGWSPTAAPALPIPQSMTVADFNGDNISDVFVALQSSTSAGSVVLRGDAQGGLTSLGNLPFGGSYRLVAADLDEDGDMDVAGTASNQVTTALTLYLNDGSGGFTDVTAARANVVSETLARIAAGDPDGDGDVDLFVGGFVLPVAFPQYLFVNHHRQVAVTSQPTVGGSLVLELNYRPGYGTGLGIGLSMAGFAAANPLPSPFGTVWVDPLTAVNLPFVSFAGINGTTQLNVALPNNPNLNGVEILVQALPIDLFDPTAPRRLTGFDRAVIVQ